MSPSQAPNKGGHTLSQAQQGLYAILDQGLLSGANFAFNLLLARWLSADLYGAYALAFTLLLLLAGFHNGLFLEPVSILGPSRYPHVLPRYFAATLRLHLWWSLSIGGLLLLGTLFLAWIAPQSPLVTVFFVLSLMQVSYLSFLLLRRSEYARQDHAAPANTVLLSFVYALVLLLGVGLTQKAGWLNAGTALAWQGFAAAAAVLSYVVQKRSTPPQGRPPQRPMWRGLALENWRYGRWIVLATVLSWSASNLYVVLTSGLLDLATAGALKAINNFVTPITQVFAALALVVFPRVSRRFAANERRLASDLWRYAALLLALLVAYVLVVSLVAAPFIEWVYAGKYMEFAPLIPLALLQLLPGAIVGPLLLGLRLHGKVKFVPLVNLFGALVTLTVGVLLVIQWGLPGAIVGAVLSQAIRLPVTYILWRRTAPHKAASNAPLG